MKVTAEREGQQSTLDLPKRAGEGGNIGDWLRRQTKPHNREVTMQVSPGIVSYYGYEKILVWKTEPNVFAMRKTLLVLPSHLEDHGRISYQYNLQIITK